MSNVQELLGLSPGSPHLATYLSSLSSHLLPTPQLKSYPDALYFNYYSLGLSLLFVPLNGYRPQSGESRQDLQDAHLVLDGVDIYNIPPPDKPDSNTSIQSSTYSPYPISPITLTVSPETEEGTLRSPLLAITQNMTGKEFVAALGEPDRKGGGAGPSSGSIGIWVEWTRDGLMVEFGGDNSRGPQAWERGKDAPWRPRQSNNRSIMAAPESVTTLDLSATWVMNKTLSDDTDEILRLQGLSWFTRRAIGLATITLYVQHYKDDDGVERIDIDQRLTGGIPGTAENRILDWTFREHEDHLFGAVLGKSRRAKLDQVENEFLKNGWLPDTEEHGVINSYVKSDTPKSGTTWIAEQIWGFEEINGERRYVRHIDFIGPENEHLQARLVYDLYNHLISNGLLMWEGFVVEESLQGERKGSHLFRWASSIWRNLESSFPYTARRANRFLIYVKGPRPVLELPDLQNPRSIGNVQVEFAPLIVGGGDADLTYRGDSFLCASAIQAGYISNSRGGCATVNLIGNFTDFLPRSANGLTSIGFPSVFPLSYRFSMAPRSLYCSDLRSEALILNVLVTAFLFLVVRPKPIITFWSLPRFYPPDIADGFGTFLPVLFVCHAFWRLAIRFVLPVFSKMPIEATILYLGPYWVTVLANLTTERIPIDRLTAKDTTAQRGGLASLITIVLVLLVLVINQIRVIRQTGWLPYYLAWYLLGGLVTLVLALLPSLHLRLHHYIIAMILMPGTAFPTRLSALYQGFLLGLFLNGTAAFGFAPILQTSSQLRRDGTFGTDLPSFITNSTNYNPSSPFSDQAISWSPLPSGQSWDGFMLLVDDVERYVGPGLNYSLAALQSGLPHFFRLASVWQFTSQGTAGDFTNAATLWPNGTWVDPSPGNS
ncbi:hypothetical protein F5148DRAFT_1145635 [Russula earlei]|uniref:Uncharacterized protein n=1 Tax=Russula earlei TaxID=71964 RepID=A0ACC0UPM2_9AGAM|nr:hypothetical protein F5148DRAFT_1145635 [Russula earlei]